MFISATGSRHRAVRLLSFGLVLVGCLHVGTALAQSTSANLRGQVANPDGGAIANATVTIRHEPSGTVSEAVTGDSGSFYQSGLRVGGPYTIEVQAADYQQATREGIYLEPGSQDPFNFVLNLDTDDMERMTVVGSPLQQAVDLNLGVGSTYSARDIANQPATDRDVIKTLVRDPLAQSNEVGILSVAGVNPRFNALAIDGSLQQDDFGLSDGTYATARSPINLDAIESATLVASDYSVTASNFTGGLVNIVTKSGTNEFNGNIYYAYQDENLIGEDFDGGTFDSGDFKEEEYGFTLGGPIIKDKLFFFVSYDEFESSAPVDFSTEDQRNGVDPAFFETLRPIIQDTFGFDPLGRPQTPSTPETSERILAKVDWNINQYHRASFTYQSSEESGVSVDPNEFESAWYDIPVDLEAYTAQLFSDWTPNLSTTFRFNLKEFSRGQICRAGPEIGQISLDFFNPSELDGTPLEGLLTEGESFAAGCDVFRHANEFNDERVQIFGKADYYLDDHILTVGSEFQHYELFNLFVPFSRGDFSFDNLDQLVNRDPASVFYSNVPSNNARDGAAEWGYDRIALFAQDRWQLTPEFELSFGLRYEWFNQADEPTFSEDVANIFGVTTDNNLDGKDLLMPRVGFLWTPHQRTNISGGIGLYAGGDPKVWTSNLFQSPTVGAFSEMISDVDPRQVPQQLVDQVANGTAIPIDFLAEDFDIPSDWKASLRFEQAFDMELGGLDLGDDYVFTAQYLYTMTNDGFLWRNIAQTQRADTQPPGVAPDGRPIYADLQDLGIPNLTRLQNFDDSDSHVFTVALAKAFESGFNFDVSYAHQDTEVVSEGTSSRGISNWRGLFSIDRNNPRAKNSPFEVKHSFNFNFGYQQNFIADLMTRFDVFGQVTSGDNWSASFDVNDDNSLFGRAGLSEDPFDNNPLYVPSPGDDPLVAYASGFDQQGFFDFVEENGIPTGQIHEPYSETSSWNQRWDFRFQQELPGLPYVGKFVGDNNFKLVFDIENFLNLIDSDWGTFQDGPFFGQAAIVQADLVSAADVAANGIDAANALTGDTPRTTCQAAGDCLYRFNQFDGDPTSFVSPEDSVWEMRLSLEYNF